MKTSEFRAWFEGFTENIDGVPTEAQFAKIKAKVAEIDETPVTERIYLDRYVYPHRRWWDNYWSSTSMRDDEPLVAKLDSASHIDKSGVAHIWDPDRNAIKFDGGSVSVAHDPTVIPMSAGAGFDSHAAMRELGRMEAMAA